MGDYTFLKYYVCIRNKWNPYSKEVKELPDHYWPIAFYALRISDKTQWENFYKPNAELSGMLSNPEAYKEYREYHDKISSKKEGTSIEAKVGDKTHAVANTHYDPNKGLVDNNGTILIPKEQFDKMSGFKGIMLSY